MELRRWLLSTTLALAVLPATLADVGQAQDRAKPALTHRWVYLSTNMLVDENIENAIAILRRASEAGYACGALAGGVRGYASRYRRWGPEQ